jgi:cytochrome c peroxidase
MSFALLRAPLRKAAFSGAIPRATFRTSYRKFSTPTPPPAPKRSNNSLFIGIGAAAAVGGLAVYLYSDSSEAGTAVKSGIQAAKVKTNFVPTKEDYQQVGVYLALL